MRNFAQVCTPLPTVTARAAYELLCSLTGSRSMLARPSRAPWSFPPAAARTMAPPGAARRRVRQLPASRPLPASTWAKPWATPKLPRTPGERRPRVCAGSVDRLTPAATAKSLRAVASGPAGTANAWAVAAWPCASAGAAIKAAAGAAQAMVRTARRMARAAGWRTGVVSCMLGLSALRDKNWRVNRLRELATYLGSRSSAAKHQPLAQKTENNYMAGPTPWPVAREYVTCSPCEAHRLSSTASISSSR